MTTCLWPNGSATRPNVSSPYGPRDAPLPGASKVHKGTDFTGFTTVRAIAAGTVVRVGTPDGWEGGGTQVWIQHDGFLSRSLHLVKGSPVVKAGDEVDAGDELATMGRTGTATGVHLHLEIVVDGVQIDPVPFITDRLAETAASNTHPLIDPIEIGEEMLIADLPNGSFLIVPQGSGKPRAVVLDAGSGAATSGIPRLKFESKGSREMLAAAVIF